MRYDPVVEELIREGVIPQAGEVRQKVEDALKVAVVEKAREILACANDAIAAARAELKMAASFPLSPDSGNDALTIVINVLKGMGYEVLSPKIESTIRISWERAELPPQPYEEVKDYPEPDAADKVPATKLKR